MKGWSGRRKGRDERVKGETKKKGRVRGWSGRRKGRDERVKGETKKGRLKG